MMGTAAVSIGAAAAVPGTLVNRAAGGGERNAVRFGHPSGTLRVGAEVSRVNGEWVATKALMSRSARGCACRPMRRGCASHAAPTRRLRGRHRGWVAGTGQIAAKSSASGACLMGTSYEKDVVAWSNEQAALLRAGQFSALDIEHLAEEIEDVGRCRRQGRRGNGTGHVPG
ncbi:hypothetical protein DFQ30_000171 [Apophysomyces sp. BC1015]|nr:hypothetical protein DFQ30_000171 [Apophysomyces sp. BC1015]